jgi:hypothetical protein
MPGRPAYFGEALLEAVRNGEVTQQTFDDKVQLGMTRLKALPRLVGLHDWCHCAALRCSAAELNSSERAAESVGSAASESDSTAHSVLLHRTAR